MRFSVVRWAQAHDIFNDVRSAFGQWLDVMHFTVISVVIANKQFVFAVFGFALEVCAYFSNGDHEWFALKKRYRA